MTKINHQRPELKHLDNLRRTLRQAARPAEEQPSVASWPPSLRPVAARPNALAALAEILAALTEWPDDGFDLSKPPSRVVEAFRSFAIARVSGGHDSDYTGREWLLAGANCDDTRTLEIRPLLLLFAEHIDLEGV